MGWGLECFYLLDGDKKGKDEKDRYSQKFGIVRDTLLTLDEVDANFVCIEDVADAEALSVIQSKLELKRKPSKKQILQFFQESLASDNIIPMGAGFEKNIKSILDNLSAMIK